jgi:GTP cyclohydrolase I
MRIDAALSQSETYYGIPRGGEIVAALAMARGYKVALKAEDADTLLDDVIDSGATETRWRELYPKHKFIALFRKDGPKPWLIFPWDAQSKAPGEDVVRRMLQLIGEDPKREGLVETPQRVVRSWLELFSGYAIDPAKVLSAHFDSDGYDQMIVCRDIQFYSTCEHHLQTFCGRAHVGYLPDKRVVGLSKLARLVDIFARRLQIQERMTEQIAAAFQTAMQPRGVGVVCEAQHFCMICRGVQKQTSSMVTSSLKGTFLEAPVRAEFFNLVKVNGH